MKKRYIVIILIIVFGLLFWALTKGISNAPVNTNNPDVSLEPDQAPAQKEGKIIVTSPLPESNVGASPISIKGRAVGNWFFEASAPVDVVNWDGLIIGQGYVTVDEGYDWMTTDMVPFSGTVSYDASQLAPYDYGWIIMKKDNPSGEPQFDDALEFKVFFK
ncbi:MAG: hypothetical protein KBC11_03355 [Candidatus Pacebacteria bacterium]|nr:hypothetical protein [Candidatus Paceibacterota bacterium]